MGSKSLSNGLDKHDLQVDSFGYSAVGMDKLGSSEYTLVTIVIDKSGSVEPFVDQLHACLKEIVQSCDKSKRKDNLMLRIVQFSTYVEETHGFKLLANCKPDDYNGIIDANGGTALYDAAANSINALADWGKQLSDQDYTVNAVVFVMTDGENNSGTFGVGEVKKALKNATQDEKLESLTSILIAVNMTDQAIKAGLEEFHKDAGFTQFVSIADASAKSLAKLAAFVSQSISSTSQALGTGGASQPVTF